MKFFYIQKLKLNITISLTALILFSAQADIDIGLRTYNGTQTLPISAEPLGTLTSPLRIGKGGNIYGVILVDPADSRATKIRMKTSTGVKALKKYSDSCNSGGTYNNATDICELAASASCTSGYSYNSPYSTCTATPSCPNGGSLSGGQCVLAATQNSSTSCSWVCNAPYQGCAPQWNDSTGGMICFLGPPTMRPCSWNDPWNGGWSYASNSCSTTYWYTCPSGFTLSGTSCYQSASCPSGGAFNSGINLCDAGASFTCVSGYTLSGTSCQSSPIY